MAKFGLNFVSLFTKAASGTSVSTMPSATIPKGQPFFVVVAVANNSTPGAVTDFHGNTYVNEFGAEIDGSASNGYLSLWSCQPGVAITTAQAITYTPPSGSTREVSLNAFLFPGSHPTAWWDAAALSAMSNGSSTTPSSSGASGPFGQRDALIGVCAAGLGTASTFTQATSGPDTTIGSIQNVTTAIPGLIVGVEANGLITSGPTYAPRLSASRPWSCFTFGVKPRIRAQGLVCYTPRVITPQGFRRRPCLS